MSVSEVTICNLALSRIGDQATVISFDIPDGSQTGEACRRFYPLALGTVLDQHPWSFATKRASLPELYGYDATPWQHAYALPSDYQRMVGIQTGDGARTTYAGGLASANEFAHEYELETTDSGLVLLTDLVNPVLRYVTSNPNTHFFTASFTDALAWKLAQSVAGELIRGDTGVKIATALDQNYQMALAQAMAADSKAHRPTRRNHIPMWIRSR